jgi:predicted RNase H-like HicB family nuclease
MMSEILFLIEENPEGGYTARAVDVGYSIFTEGESEEELKMNIVEALQCHFESEQDIPKLIRLHFIKDEVMHYAPAS